MRDRTGPGRVRAATVWRQHFAVGERRAVTTGADCGCTRSWQSSFQTRGRDALGANRAGNGDLQIGDELDQAFPHHPKVPPRRTHATCCR